MKKVILLITSLLAISTACFAGCTNKQSGNDEQDPDKKNYEIMREEGDANEDEEKCPDGNCEKDEAVPDFMFRPHRHGDFSDDQRPDAPEFDLRHAPRRHHHMDAETRSLTDDGEDKEVDPQLPDQRLPRGKKGNCNPQPKPMPAKPRNN